MPSDILCGRSLHFLEGDRIDRLDVLKVKPLAILR